MKLKYTDGTLVNAADFADAMQSVRLNYPDAVAYQGGSEVSDDDDVGANGRILIWADEEGGVNDDGANAIAEIEAP